MNILFAASEVVPFAKTGGLADVAAALPKAIRNFGHDIRIFMPRYKFVDCQDTLPGTDIKIYFFENEHFAKRDDLYVVNGKDYPDNGEAFLSYCQGLLPFLKEIDWQPSIIHCNDWQTAPIIMYLKEQRASDPFFQRTASAYSVHNMAYQGKYAVEGFPYDSFAEAGFLNADVISSVSETYAKEIQTEEYGCGLESVLRERSGDIYGIVNGVDYDLWNPATDQKIARKFSRKTLSLRPANKAFLQKEMRLPVKDEIPVLGITSRLDIQKGFDILLAAIDEIMGLKCQLVVLGTGDPKYHKLLEQAKKKYPDQIGLKLGFDADLAQKIYAGSDMFLMPSKYEPCGLGQLISFKYGAIPIVRKTGGLADTVHDYDPKTGEGDGFVFEDYSAEALISAVKRAIDVYKNKTAWLKMRERVMGYDYSWAASAKKYISLYMKAIDKILT